METLISLFISNAYAEAAPAGGQQADWSGLIMMLGIFVIFYFLFIRPQSKKAKEHKQMTEALAKGDEVVTVGGILGKVVEIHENFVTVEVAKDNRINIQRQSVGSLMPKGTIKSLKD